jgi:hypothetical protein
VRLLDTFASSRNTEVPRDAHPYQAPTLIDCKLLKNTLLSAKQLRHSTTEAAPDAQYRPASQHHRCMNIFVQHRNEIM